jgi:RNA polymerase sigma factor (sigma-70 family)
MNHELAVCTPWKDACFRQTICRCYSHLVATAASMLDGESRSNLEPHELVSVACLRVVRVHTVMLTELRLCPPQKQSARVHALLCKVMRHVLTDEARKRKSAKRGGNMIREPQLEDIALYSEHHHVETEDLLEWCRRTAGEDFEMLVAMGERGLTRSEIARLQGVTVRSIRTRVERLRRALRDKIAEHDAASSGFSAHSRAVA